MNENLKPVSSKNGGSCTITADSRDSSCEGLNFDLKSSRETERVETNSLISEATNSVKPSIENITTSNEVQGAESNSKRQISCNLDCTFNGCIRDQEEGTEQNSTTVMSDAFANEDGEHENSIPTPEEHPMLHSVKYLEKHHILRLFQNLAAEIVYRRPDNPLQFLVEELEKSRRHDGASSEEQETGSDLFA